MKYVKEYGILLLKFFGFLVGGSIMVSVLYYFLMPTKVVKIISFVYMLLLFLGFGFKAGKETEAKGFLAGLKIGGIFLLLEFLMSLFLNRFEIHLFTFLYYGLLLLSSVFGSMLGINTKNE